MSTRHFIKGQVKVEKGTGQFAVIASTDTIDRQGESIDQNGWDLTNYMNNPIILWAHDYSALPIGVAENVTVGEQGLTMQGRFASADANPMAENVRKLYEDGILRTVSVGFIPKERNGSTITKAELLEVSFVPVPANPQALSLAMTKGMQYEPALVELIEKCAECDVTEPKTEEPKAEEPVTTKPEICKPDSPEFDPQACGAIFCDPESPDYNQEFCDEMKAHIAEREAKKTETETEAKSGRVLSTKNRTLISGAIETMKTSIASLEALLNATEPAERQGNTDTTLTKVDHVERSDRRSGFIEIPEETLKELLTHSRQAEKKNELANAIIKRALKK